MWVSKWFSSIYKTLYHGSGSVKCRYHPHFINETIFRYKARDSFNVTLFSDTHTSKIQYKYTLIRCVGVAKEGNIKRAPALISTTFSQIYNSSHLTIGI